jgi:H+-transporting ATPase
MKNFVIYRVACTQQLLLFFFITCLYFNPHQVNPRFGASYFSIPVLALVSITILNDGTIVSVAYDNVQASTKPEKWRLVPLYIVSTSIGLTALASSIILLHLALHCSDEGSLWRRLGLDDMEYAQIQTLMYLKISLTDYISVFNSRCQGWMWSRAPSQIVVVSAAFAMALATCFALYLPPGMSPISSNAACFVWLYVLAWALIQDVAKVVTYHLLEVAGLIESKAVVDERVIDGFKSCADQADCCDVEMWSV